MRPRITWRYWRRWAAGEIVHSVPEFFRRDYGDALADIVQLHAAVIRERRAGPMEQDIRATLERIAADPAGADLGGLDSTVDCELVRSAHRLNGAVNLRSLGANALAEAAIDALSRRPHLNGPRPTDGAAKRLIRALLENIPATFTPAQRDELITCALIACGLRFTPKTVQRLRTAVGRIERSGKLFSRTRGSKPKTARGRVYRSGVG